MSTTSQHLTFDDVSIMPGFSTVKSRQDVDTSYILYSMTDFYLDLPIISSNMETITGPEMCIAMIEANCIGALHRFCTIKENVLMVEAVNKYLASQGRAPGDVTSYFASIGIGDEEKERFSELYNAGARAFMVDIAHGHSEHMIGMLKWITDIGYEDIMIVAGNVATPEGVEDLLEAGAHMVKVGVGSGSACTTRVKTGVGVPQLSAILECAQVGPIISDGGIRTPGDVCKALAAGADLVMIGGMFAGCKETPGEVIRDEGGEYEYKLFKGSAYRQGVSYKTSEGVSTRVRARGSVKDVIKDINGGLRSCMSYIGAEILAEISQKAKLIEVSRSAYEEGLPHILRRN